MSTFKKGQWGFTEQKIERVFSYDWTINNYSFLDKSSGQRVESPIFSLKKTNWCLRFYPNGTNSSYPNSLYLGLYASDTSNNFIGTCVLSVLNNKGEQFANSKQKIVVGTQSLESNIIQKDVLLNKANGLLPNDCLTIRCEFFEIGDLVNVSSLSKEKTNRKSKAASESNGLEKLFLDERLSDVKLIASCGKFLRAHKNVLTTCSPVFEAMFMSDMLEKTKDEVKINDGDFAALKEMLRFIYTGKVENVEAVAADLIQLADKYEMIELRNLCEEELNDAISTDNVLDVLAIAHYHNIEHLKANALNFTKGHLGVIANSEAFNSLKNDEVLKCIIKAISQNSTSN